MLPEEAEKSRIILLNAAAIQADAENRDALVGAALDVLLTESHEASAARVLHLDPGAGGQVSSGD